MSWKTPSYLVAAFRTVVARLSPRYGQRVHAHGQQQCGRRWRPQHIVAVVSSARLAWQKDDTVKASEKIPKTGKKRKETDNRIFSISRTHDRRTYVVVTTRAHGRTLSGLLRARETTAATTCCPGPRIGVPAGGARVHPARSGATNQSGTHRWRTDGNLA